MAVIQHKNRRKIKRGVPCVIESKASVLKRWVILSASNAIHESEEHWNRAMTLIHPWLWWEYCILNTKSKALIEVRKEKSEALKRVTTILLRNILYINERGKKWCVAEEEVGSRSDFKMWKNKSMFLCRYIISYRQGKSLSRVEQANRDGFYLQQKELTIGRSRDSLFRAKEKR